MCSRYYIDLDMMEEISRVVQNIDGRIRLTQGDIRPDRCRTGHWTVRT